tara:strand:+ start:1579 stop:2130 length:552 start_codon:yes stop_codon:yes gene_type:complete
MLLIRFFDLSIAIIFLVLFIPLFLIIIILIYISSGLPIIYISKRIGKYGKEFNIYKFRTMENYNNEQPTKIGLYLRRTSIDETLQLINIIKGEMSIVGPRPLPSNLDLKISKIHRKLRQSVRPGLTGLSQINFKGPKRSLSEKVVLDISMIKDFNLILYFKIIVLTFPVIFRRFYYNNKGATL